MTDDPSSVPKRLTDLERRVDALEGKPSPPARAEAGEAGEAGAVRYSGEVHLHGDVTWRVSLDARAALDLAAEPRVAVLAALGHPARARIVCALLAGGPSGTTALQEAAGLASTGQLYHHLRSLTPQRGSSLFGSTTTQERTCSRQFSSTTCRISASFYFRTTVRITTRLLVERFATIIAVIVTVLCGHALNIRPPDRDPPMAWRIRGAAACTSLHDVP